MSMNLHLHATCKITRHLKNVDKVGIDTDSFDLYQTPTKVTREILASENILKAYADWVLSITEVEYSDVYADDDFFYEREPIGRTSFHPGQEHLNGLNEWLAAHEGWDLEWFEM